MGRFGNESGMRSSAPYRKVQGQAWHVHSAQKAAALRGTLCPLMSLELREDGVQDPLR